jgi:hypothetical protein
MVGERRGERKPWRLIDAVQVAVDAWAAWMIETGRGLPDHDLMYELRKRLSVAVCETKEGDGVTDGGKGGKT